ncbi:MAG: DUF4097 family beta strand repeat-containing protein [Lachnospiraceae bacterium]
MTDFEKGVKAFAIALAVILSIAVIGGIVGMIGNISRGFQIGAEAVSEAAESASEAISDSTSQVHQDFYNGVAQHFSQASDYYFSPEEVDELSIENGIGSMTVRESDNEKIHVLLGNPTEYSEVKLSGSTLKVENSGVDVEIFGIRIGEKVDNENGGMVIELPRGIVFEEVSIENGIGNMEITGLKADEITIATGTGSLSCEDIDADEIRVESGVGEVKMNFSWPMNTYDMRIEPGVGSIIINGVKQSETNHTNRDASKTLRLSSSIGSIIVDFSEQ